MLYSTATAAERLGLSVATVKYHLYIAKDLKPDYVLGARLIFTEETLATHSCLLMDGYLIIERRGSTMKKATFNIHTKDGFQERSGWLINDWFACHKDYRDWKLTHLPTGMLIPGNYRRRSDAASLAEFLNERADWSFTDPSIMSDAHTNAGRDSKDRMDYDVVYHRYEWRATP